MALRAIVDAKHKVFIVPYTRGLAAIVPPVAEYDDPDKGRMIVLPHNRDTTRLARNFGFTIAAPIMSQYQWGSEKPFKAQRLTAAMLTMHKRAYVLSEMGTGKTRASLFAADFLLRHTPGKSALIAAPLSTLTPVWDLEAMYQFPHLTTATLHGDKAKRLKLLNKPADLYLINHDGIETILDELNDRRDIDIILIDELGEYSNNNTNRWESMESLIYGREYVWGMTGSPIPKAPTDAWAQIRLLTPNSVTPHYARFRKQTMYKFSQFRWVAKDDAKETVYAAMQPAIRFTRDEVVELPPLTHSTRDVPQSSLQAAAYKTLVKHLRIAYEEGNVTAANEGVLQNKLLQVACGWVYTEDRSIVELDPAPRLDALKQIIREASHKVIVFVTFKHAAQYVREALESTQEYAGQVLFVTGDVGKTERDKVFSEFAKPGGARILVAHPGCMSHGLNLAAANVIVWYCLPQSLRTFDQACARITRPDQKNNMYIIYLIGTPIEKRVYARLQKQAVFQGALLEMFESEREIA